MVDDGYNDDDDDDDEDNPGCLGNSGIIGALAPPRIWDYLPNLLSLKTRVRKLFLSLFILFSNPICFWR